MPPFRAWQRRRTITSARAALNGLDADPTVYLNAFNNQTKEREAARALATLLLTRIQADYRKHGDRLQESTRRKVQPEIGSPYQSWPLELLVPVSALNVPSIDVEARVGIQVPTDWAVHTLP